MTAVAVKICGIKDSKTAVAAARAGADYLGFIFFRKSPRCISAEQAEDMTMALKEASFEEGFALPKLVGLFVDAGEKEIAEAAPFLTHFQFHGHESPERVEELGVEFAVDVIKAIPVGEKGDVALADEYADAADMLLFDAKPPPGAGRPGGLGITYDWSMISAYQGETPYLLAGGLTPDNVADAVATQKKSVVFQGVDVSSGVENAPGVKDLAAVASFIDKAKS